jgi:thymidylate synthase
MPEVFPHFQAAYLTQLRKAHDHPEFVNAPRGNKSREHIGISFRIEDPVQRHITLPARRTNIIFNFAEVLWYLSGSRDLDVIAYYAPSIAKYSRDGRTLAGTAYGPRIFRMGPSEVDQWDSVVRTLSGDRDSKRAVIQIFDASELVVPDNIDVSCTLALQFLIRAGALHGVGFMRANDAFRGAVSDVFSFTFMLELMATQLGLDIGTYTHQVGSFHVYNSDVVWARRVIEEATGTVADPAPFPRMPAGDNWPHVREVHRLEEQLRLDRLRLGANEVAGLDLPPYWRDIVALLEIQRQLRHRTAANPDVVAMLPDLYHSLVVTRWPQLKPAPRTRAA